MMVEQRRRSNECSAACQCRQHRAYQRVEAPLWYVFRREPLVYGRALLEEKHPGRHRGADVRGQDQQKFLKAATRERRP